MFEKTVDEAFLELPILSLDRSANLGRVGLGLGPVWLGLAALIPFCHRVARTNGSNSCGSGLRSLWTGPGRASPGT